MEYIDIIILSSLNFIFGLPITIILLLVYCLLNKYNKYYLIIIYSMFNWILYNLSGFIYIKIFTLFTMFILNFEYIYNYYSNIRNIMDFNEKVKNLGIVDDDIQKEMEEIEYLNHKLKYYEGIYGNIKKYLLSSRLKIKFFINNNILEYHHVYNNIFIDMINNNCNFFYNELMNINYIKSIKSKVIKYHNIYNHIKDKNNKNNTATKIEDISKVVSGINNMMSLMTNLPKFNDNNKDINFNNSIITSLTDKIPFKMPNLFSESNKDNIMVNNKKKNKKK